MSGDIQEVINQLFNNPRALLFLCFKGNKLTKSPSINILNRGVECEKLQELGLAKQIDDKHLHTRPCIITSTGYQVLERLEELGIIRQINEDVDCHNPTQFEIDIKQVIDNCTKKSIQVPDIFFLEGFPPLGSWIGRSSARGLVHFKPENIEIKGQNYVSIRVQVRCPRCEMENQNEYEMNEDNFLDCFEFICPNCSLSINISRDLRYLY